MKRTRAEGGRAGPWEEAQLAPQRDWPLAGMSRVGRICMGLGRHPAVPHVNLSAVQCAHARGTAKGRRISRQLQLPVGPWGGGGQACCHTSGQHI